MMFLLEEEDFGRSEIRVRSGLALRASMKRTFPFADLAVCCELKKYAEGNGRVRRQVSDKIEIWTLEIVDQGNKMSQYLGIHCQQRALRSAAGNL